MFQVIQKPYPLTLHPKQSEESRELTKISPHEFHRFLTTLQTTNDISKEKIVSLQTVQKLFTIYKQQIPC